jgi:RimJ/RimL family protein N-acetyltransferase
MNFNLQVSLENELIAIRPLDSNDFEDLYLIASDPLLWEQHPSKTRYQREVFQNFFKGAIESNSAFLVYDKANEVVIGTSRYYDYDAIKSTVVIGYTFISRSYWGRAYNMALKKLMLDYAFQFVDAVHFHIGANNIRSQTAIGRLGAKKIDEQQVAYYGEQHNLNFIYEIRKEEWNDQVISRLRSK